MAGYGSTHDRAFVSGDGRTTFAIAYPPPDPDQPFGDNPKAERRARAALRGARVAGAPVHLSGYDALANQSGGDEGPGVLLEACCRWCCARWARGWTGPIAAPATTPRGRGRAGPGASSGGLVAQNADFIDAVYGNFPLMIALISIITFILLDRAFRSLLLPAKAVVLNVISVCSAWGVLVLFWQQGHGSEAIWSIPATGSITAWIPLMVFAFLFGPSMDYEVFILARMREEYDATGDTDEAIVRGIGRTGRLVTSAALILFLAIVSMASGPQTDVKVLATGPAAGILLDATVIRALLVLAVASLFGRWNWSLPPAAARILRVDPSTARPPAAESA